MLQLSPCVGAIGVITATLTLGPAERAKANEQSIIEFFKTRYIVEVSTGCFRGKSPTGSGYTDKLYIKDDSLIWDVHGSPPYVLPINGSKGHLSNSISENSITIRGGTKEVFTTVYTLSADRTQCSVTLCGSGWVGRNISCSIVSIDTQSPIPNGVSPIAVERNNDNPQSATTKMLGSEKGMRKSSSCSDITGTKEGAKSNRNCPEPGGKLPAAQAAKAPARNAAPMPQTTPATQTATPTAGQQAALAGAIVDELGKVRSGQVSEPVTGTSTPPDRDFDPRKADPHRTEAPPEPPQQGQICTSYFHNMITNFQRDADLCIKDKALLRSLTEISGADIVTTDDDTSAADPNAGLMRNTPPRKFVIDVDPMDPRWKTSGDTIGPNCNLPMTVASQSEAFTECARVYLCGIRAALCGYKRARATKTDQCLPISRACLAENPIPQRMAKEDPAPSPYRPPVQSRPLPNSPHRDSTITGPSGPGSGGASGGVRSAQ